MKTLNETQKTLTIGQVAKLADVNRETIRFYEREGLIEEPARRESGYRQYSYNVVKRILFIKRAKGLGFTLQEIKELLALRVDGAATCGEVKQRTLTKLTDIDQKIRDLQRMKKSLHELAEACSGDGRSASECPILDAFEPKENE